jgi:hypothetical protein
VARRRKMAKERFEVIKFDKRTGKEVGVVFSTLNQGEAERVTAKHNDDLTPQQKEKIEFRCRPGNPSYRIRMANK